MNRLAEARGVGRIYRAINSIVGELRKVAWPSREDAIRLTAIVLAVTLVIALILWGFDTVFTELVNLVLID